MPDTRENLSNDDDQSCESLSFTVEEMFAEIEDTLLQPMQPGDVSVAMVSQRFDISEDVARSKMKKLAKTGKYTLVDVINPDTGHRVMVLRNCQLG